MKVSILDCTLRDGGYVNGFRFGVARIRALLEGLCEANIEMVECGFLRTGHADPDCTLYGSVSQIRLPEGRAGRMFLAMVEHGGISVDDIEPRQEGFIDGIRLSFHNSEWEATRKAAEHLMAKGYQVFIQPIGTVSYTDAELLALVEEVNELRPFAFYIVDTLGSMYRDDLLRMFLLVEHNLGEGIALGFHSHNNLQLSFANAMALLGLHTDRHLIVDSSVFGMGRGAGNLNTELIAHYINSSIEERYGLAPLLEIIDDIVLPIYKYAPWGFSEPYYLSAIKGVHPNYASYLIGKRSMNMGTVMGLLDRLPEADRHLFRKGDIEDVYHAEMSRAVEDSEAVAGLSGMVAGRDVLVLAPGPSVRERAGDIAGYIRGASPFVVSLNFVPEGIVPDLVFVSNRRRLAQVAGCGLPLAVTSNVPVAGTPGAYVVDYGSLLKGGADSGGAMALRLLARLGAARAVLAGFDGFTDGMSHYSEGLDGYLDADTVAALNASMAAQLAGISKEVEIGFITPSPYEGAL
jgi:4-hydroxy 2-oxovalerate aldolase